MHVMCLSPCWKPTPAVASKSKQCYFLFVCCKISMTFPNFPLFPSFLAFIFISGLVLCPLPNGPKVKEVGILSLFSFMKRCMLGISMATHTLPPPLCDFGVFLCAWSDWCGALWLNHATTNLIKEANSFHVLMFALFGHVKRVPLPIMNEKHNLYGADRL